MEQPGLFAGFADRETETRYNERARTLRLPFVRLYGVILLVVLIAYSIINPLYIEPVENAILAFWLGLTILVGGIYIGVTFWPGYVRHPMLDFAALLVIGLLVSRVNVVLFDHLLHSDAQLRAVGVFNRLAITAFAAVTLAGRPKLFLAWLGCDFVGWIGQVMPGQQAVSALAYALLSYLSGALIMAAINLAVGLTSRSAFRLADSLDIERSKNEELLLNMLPPAAVARIRSGLLVADSYADASVIFIDMVGFSALAKRVSPGHLVELLNGFFNHADACAREHGIEKVKTVGDAYLAIAGGNVPSGNSADAAIAFARAVIAGVDGIGIDAGVEVGLRAGIHSGPVVGGVIGATRMAYDYWGDTVNIAARLEGTAPPNAIAISESTWLRARSRDGFGPPTLITLKGVGEMSVFHASARTDTGETVPAAA
ncbi:adenylate/guanylate cyclase domain-containing protein [Novosphingobium sp. KCTC 2891]|uniref:adenylate/guanylate cyclase domain-containing protein n=1 Tax=Novosphingobium sp. KCTC 2891 TaxID=2989730 RepID=UPI002221874C|nr:adenylate/guanylate cyclase domain-containing protein [Novosphingobium sp. KCTC 2891]MCW1382841.1 adenylate/guanylate cyclase domain-containing protein [Novosphingobium sp. KCTC 2891]